MDITYVKAVFGSLRKTRTQPVYRDDHDLILQLVGVKGLPVHFQAHFANSEYGTAVVMMGSDGEVSIPNTLLATGLPVYCWILVEQGISGAVRYSVQIPVRQKARPDGTIPPEQADIISQAISALNDAGTAAQEAADSAAQSAADAADSAASANADAQTASDAKTYVTEQAGIIAETRAYIEQNVVGFEDKVSTAISDVEEAGAVQKNLAKAQAKNSEAWAVGNRGGSAVPPTDPTYHNNAKYYAEQAAESARTLTIDDTLTEKGQAADSASVRGIITATGNYDIVNFEHGKYIPTDHDTVNIDDKRASSNLKLAVLDCQPGDVFTINGTGGLNGRLWCFVDISGNVLARSDASATATNLLLEAPINSSKLIVHNLQTDRITSFIGNIPKNRMTVLESEIDELKDQRYNELYKNYVWVQGGLTIGNGGPATTNSRCRIQGYLHFDYPTKISVIGGYQFNLLKYSTNATSGYIGVIREFSNESYKIEDTESFYRIALKQDDDTDFEPADIPEDCITISVYKNTGIALTESAEKVSSEIKKLFSGRKEYPFFTWAQGGISNSGSNQAATNRLRGQYIYYADSILRIRVKTGYKFGVFRFGIQSSPSSFIDSLPISAEEKCVECDHSYIRFVIAKEDDSDITSQDAPKDILEIEFLNYDQNYPQYYSGYMMDKIKKIDDAMFDVGCDGETFVFITDIHWTTGNAKKSPALIKLILNNTSVNTIICGGDLINEGVKETEINRIKDCIQQFNYKEVPFVTAFGNHDSNKNNQASYPERWFDRNTVFSLIMKPASNHVKYLNNVDWSFTYDRSGTKTRFLFVDTGTSGTFDNNAKQSIYSSFKDVPEGWHVIVVGHWLYSITNSGFTETGAELVSVIEAYNSKSTITISGTTYDYTDAKGTVTCILIGHSHNNAEGVTTGGIPWLMTDSDNYGRSNVSGREPNSLSEQCFDIVSVNHVDNTVKVIRIGHGSDREFAAGSWTILQEGE